MSEPELCMCGADDCRLCRPLSWRESSSEDDEVEFLPEDEDADA
jgi:hypothetical protein